MEILKFDSAPRQSRGKSKSKTKPLFAIISMVAITAVGTTLAGSININSGQAVEFGQGVSITASCDANGGITASPTATYINGLATAGSFALGTISFTGIDSTCAGKVFTLKAYNDVAGAAPLALNTTGTGSTTQWNFATFAFSPITPSSKSSNINVGNYSSSGNNGTINVGFLDTRTVSAANVEKFTLESSAS